MTCQICFEDKKLVKGPYECTTDHFFCHECIDKWKEKQNNCPICRSKSIYSPLSQIQLMHSWCILSTNRHMILSSTPYYNTVVLPVNTLNETNTSQLDANAGLFDTSNNTINYHYTPRRRFRRSRSEIQTMLTALESYDSDEIYYGNFDELLSQPTTGINPGQIAPSPPFIARTEFLDYMQDGEHQRDNENLHPRGNIFSRMCQYLWGAPELYS